MQVFGSLDEFAGAVGTELGPTDWVLIDQDRVNTFAEATGDHQWIHVDVERAAQGPFGGPIAHGLLTLALFPMFMGQLYQVEGVKLAVNYGYNKVRFISPVPVGARMRVRATLTQVDEVRGGKQAILTATAELEGSDKPACVAESVVRYLA